MYIVHKLKFITIISCQFIVHSDTEKIMKHCSLVMPKFITKISCQWYHLPSHPFVIGTRKLLKINVVVITDFKWVKEPSISFKTWSWHDRANCNFIIESLFIIVLQKYCRENCLGRQFNFLIFFLPIIAFFSGKIFPISQNFVPTIRTENCLERHYFVRECISLISTHFFARYSIFFCGYGQWKHISLRYNAFKYSLYRSILCVAHARKYACCSIKVCDISHNPR